MASTITLDGTDGGRLDLDISPDGWCKCWLLADGHRRYLGADAAKRVISRLIAGLRGENSEASDEIAGHQVYWVLTLSEAHCTLYVACTNSGRLFYIQDANAEVIAMVSLSHASVTEWLTLLGAFPKH